MPETSSLGTRLEGCASAFETASLNFKLSICRYEPSWTRGVGLDGAETGDGRRRLPKANLLSDLTVLSGVTEVSVRVAKVGAGEGEEGRLAGRKKWGFLRTFIVSSGFSMSGSGKVKQVESYCSKSPEGRHRRTGYASANLSHRDICEIKNAGLNDTKEDGRVPG